MKSLLILLALLAAQLTGYAASANDSLSNSPQLTPLVGRVDRSTNIPGSLLDPRQFQGNVDQSRADGSTSVNVPSRFPLDTEQSQYQGYSQAQRFDSGTDQPALQGQATARGPFPLRETRSGNPDNISEREIALLGTYDVVVLLDKSYSMGTKDCPPPSLGNPMWDPFKISRWQWCFNQIQNLSGQMSRLPNRGIRVVLFDSHFWVFDNVSLMQLPEIFANFHPWNGTKLLPPLTSQFQDYLRRRATGRVRPLLIAIITDGRPHDDYELAPAIVELTRQMRNPREIFITFLQVGNNSKGEWFVSSLDHCLPGMGARYDIVESHMFPELLQRGLTRSLISAIDGHRKTSWVNR